MIGPIRSPLLTALYALLGVAVASVWIKYSLGWLIVSAVTVAAAVVAIIAERSADQDVTRKPLRALHLYEARSVLIGIVSALVGGLVVLITIWAGALAGEKDPQKTLVTTAGAALTALISGVFVSVKETDEALGKHVRDEFRTRFKLDERIEAGSAAEKAIYSDYEGEWSDWSRSTRRKRIEEVKKVIDP